MSLLRVHTLVIGAWFIVALVITMSVVLGVPVTATQSAGWLALAAMLSASVLTMFRRAASGDMTPVGALTRRQKLGPAPRNRR